MKKGKRKLSAKKSIFFISAFVLLSLFGLLMFNAYHKVDRIAGAHASGYLTTIVLDAGHGGEDGGTTGVNHLQEKDINLQITSYLRDMLVSTGFPVVMLRDGDYAINDKDLSTIKERKASDLRNRLKLLNSYDNSIFVSIHQNHFTESKYTGAQMFYSTKTPESKLLAESMKNAVVSLLQPENNREIKPATKSIYLLYNAKQTAVLAECGFLSNPTEAAKLASDDYQRQMAFSIYCGILDYWRQAQAQQ